MRIDRIALAVLLCAGSTSARADDYKCKEADPATKLVATFGPTVSLHDLSVWILGFTCKNVVFSADVAKHATKLTVIAPKPMSPKQALQLFVDAVEATGLVVQQKPDTIVIKPGPTMPKTCPDLADAPRQPKTYDAIPTTTPEPDDDLAKAIAAIKKLDATHYEIPQATIDLVLANPMAVSKGARVVPSMKNGKPEGIKLYAITPLSLWAKIGFANGDTFIAVNGMPLTDAEQGLAIYQKLRDAKRLDISLIRAGTPLVLTITIK